MNNKIIKTPRIVDMGITAKCNLRCKYCYHFTGPGDVKEELSRDEWLGFFEELGRCAVMEVFISGGEPFYREDLKDLINGVVKNRMRFRLLSNGTLITDEMASFIAATGRCNSVQVSIDGASPKTHDLSRGEGNFERAVNGIRILQKHKIPVTIRVTINRYNVRDLEEISRLLLEVLGFGSFSTNSATYLGLCKYNTEEVQLGTEERLMVMETLLKLNRKYNNRISAQAGPLAEARHWREMETARREGKKEMQNRGFLRSCGGVFNKVAVRADGVMVPCNQMSHIELGKIGTDRLIEVWQDSPELRRLRDRRNIPLTEFDFCRGCEYIPYCTGNCPAVAFTLVGKENHPIPDACLKRFLEAGGRLPEP